MASEKSPWHEPGFKIIDGQRIFVDWAGIVWIEGRTELTEPPFGVDEAALLKKMTHLWDTTAASGKYTYDLDTAALTNRPLSDSKGPTIQAY